ncbi:MAG: protein-glutamate O-methyltransferase CheR [Gemmatimonadetes bacterium]|nr:protein-glutamate O-methyltransferase CheR [Gemmatimonadota bacterium]
MTRMPVLSVAAVEAAADLVRRCTGLAFSGPRHSALRSGLVKAMQRAGATDPGGYMTALAEDPTLLDDLVAELTVGETYFFRDTDQFSLIRDEILPAMVARRARPLRIWSAGCATGEEPYTLAILVREHGGARDAHILGTDLSTGALARAWRASYGRWSLRGVPDRVVSAYFERVGDRFELIPSLRAAVEFRYLNLVEDSYPSLATGVCGMDLILCRNVLIYFDNEAILRVARRLLDSLSDDGWLLLGAADPPLGDIVPCQVVVTRAGLAYRRSAGRSVSLPSAWRSGGPEARHEFPFRPVEAASDGSAANEPQVPRRRGIRVPELTPRPRQSAPTPPAASEAETGGVPQDATEVVRRYREGDYAGAAELARRLVPRDGGDAGVWILLVRALANRGDLVEAGRACAAALDRHRASAELTYLHAVLLGEAGRDAEAAEAARRALYLDRRLVVAHLALGGALARLGDRDGAGRAFRNAERLLEAVPPREIVPAADGEPAGRLAEIARVQRALLSEERA